MAEPRVYGKGAGISTAQDVRPQVNNKKQPATEGTEHSEI
jgi:hypothetical protein